MPSKLEKVEDELVYVLNVKNEHLQTLLHVAVQQNSLKATTYLLTKDKDFLTSKKFGIIRCMDYITKSINEKDENNRTPLKIAIGNGNYDIAVALLENGAWFDDLNAENNVEQCSNPELNEIIILINDAFVSVKKGELDELKKYLSNNILPVKCIDKNGRNMLHYAVVAENQNCFELASVLLQMESNANVIDNSGNTVLFYAVENQNMNCLKLLLQNMPFSSVEEFEITNENVCKEMINMLYSLFYIMEYYDEDRFISHLSNFEASFDLSILCNAFDKEEYTLLHHAVERGYIKIVKMLLKNGATISESVEKLATNVEIKSLLHLITTSFDNIKILEKKCSQKIIDMVNKDEINYEIITNARRYETLFYNKPARAITLLHKAALLGEFKTVRWLVKKGANLEVQDNFGCTPIMLAEEHNQSKIVDFLKSAKTTS